MTQELKEYVEKVSGRQVAHIEEDKLQTERSFMRQVVTINGVTYVIRMHALMDGRLDVWYFRKENNESKCII